MIHRSNPPAKTAAIVETGRYTPTANGKDGIRINSPTVEPIIPVAENYPLYNAKQVEILYGPASAIYGADAFSGVINIITENAPRDATVRATVEGGEFDSYRVDVYGAKRYNDGVAVSLGGHYQETDGPDLDEVSRPNLHH